MCRQRHLWIVSCCCCCCCLLLKRVNQDVNYITIVCQSQKRAQALFAGASLVTTYLVADNMTIIISSLVSQIGCPGMQGRLPSGSASPWGWNPLATVLKNESAISFSSATRKKTLTIVLLTTERDWLQIKADMEFWCYPDVLVVVVVVKKLLRLSLSCTFRRCTINAYNASKARFEYFTILEKLLQNISFHRTNC